MGKCKGLHEPPSKAFVWFDEDASVVEAGIGKRRSAAPATQRVAAWSRAGLL